MAFKNFAVGEILTSSDVNSYLMRQAVIRCTSGTRPSPEQGMHIYETDTNRTMRYTGSVWEEMGGTQPSAHVSGSATVAGPSQTVSFSGETWDTAGIWDAGQPTRLTAPAGGVWAFGGAVRWSSLPASNLGFGARVDRFFNAGSSTTALEPSAFVNGSTYSAYTQNFSGVSQMLAGEWFTLRISHSYASSLTASSIAFWAYRISS